MDNRELLETEVALRYWPVCEIAKPESRRSVSNRPDIFERSLPIGARLLVFDTETTADEYQALRFGFYRIYERGRLAEEGLFVSEFLEAKEPQATALCKDYADKHSLNYLTRREFAYLLIREGYGIGTLIVGFNLPYDLSRVAIWAGIGRGKNRDAFFLRLAGEPSRPDLRVKAIGDRAAFMQWLKPKNNGNRRGARRHFSGRFLDLGTLSHALSGKFHSLRSAGEAFKAHEPKAEIEGHDGPLTTDYLDYARQDVAATYSLYLGLKAVYDSFPFADCGKGTGKGKPNTTAITELYSPASIAKACLRFMGMPNTHDAFAELPAEYCGYAMAAYFGGRSEVHVRRVAVAAAEVDFTSQYPAVFTLLRLWPIFTAAKFGVSEIDPAEAERLLIDIAQRPGALFKPETWGKLVGFAQVVPHGDILPVRFPKAAGEEESREDNSAEVAVTVASLCSEAPTWFALPDLVASVILTGKVPRIVRAFTDDTG